MIMEEELKHYLFNPMVGRILAILVGALLIWAAVTALQKSLFSKIKNNENHYKAKKISNFIGYVFTIVLIAIVFSDKLTGITFALGAAGVGIAFALQEVIASFAGWLMVIIGGFYKPGDRVQLGGIKGDVMDVGVLRTTIMETGQWVDGDQYNGRIVLIANSFVFKEPVFNYSGQFPFLWDEIKIPIQYGSNYEQFKTMLLSIGNEVTSEFNEPSRLKWNEMQQTYRLEDAQTDPMVSLIANDNWVEFTLRYVVNYKKRRATKTELFTQILKAVEATEGQIRFASTTTQLVGAPEFKVNINKQDQ